MTCVIIEHGFICGPATHRLRLSDGTCVFMEWHSMLGPEFFRDYNCTRLYEKWWDNPRIIEALNWFIKRGHRS